MTIKAGLTPGLFFAGLSGGHQRNRYRSVRINFMHAAVTVINVLFRAYILLVIVWVLGSWFPQWRYQSWFRYVDGLVRPYIELFKVLPLRIGMMDLSPMVAILVLYLFQYLLMSVAVRGF